MQRPPVAPSLLAVALLASAALATACGGGAPEAEVPIAREGPAEEIFRVGKEWESQATETGFRTPPSPIATFSGTVLSRVVFSDDQRTAKETLRFEATYKMQNGREFRCTAGTEVTLPVRFADHHGEAAVEMQRPRVELVRRCVPDGFPEPRLDLPPATARFALRADRLVAFAPAAERREYLPLQ